MLILLLLFFIFYPAQPTLGAEGIVCQNQAEFDSLNTIFQDSCSVYIQGYSADTWQDSIITNQITLELGIAVGPGIYYLMETGHLPDLLERIEDFPDSLWFEENND